MYNSVDSGRDALVNLAIPVEGAPDAQRAVGLGWTSVALVLTLAASCASAIAQTKPASPFDGIGRTATANEIKAWDIDVRPDFKGLPKGQGSVSRGETVWEAQCASCHGTFAESNEVFAPIVGYTSAKDIATGNVASLKEGSTAPTRTTMMKVSQLSTLWDYINRAMPWTAPKSLSADDVYAVTAFILNLANVVPPDYTLSEKNMADAQKRLPNRNGNTLAHGMWPGAGSANGSGMSGMLTKPDVQGSSCVRNCAIEPKVASLIPDYARDAHGNLADQSRTFGGSRGAKTTKNDEKQAAPLSGNAQAATKNVANGLAIASTDKKLTASDVTPTLQKYACAACHGIDNKQVGPSFREILAKQGIRSDAQAYLVGKIQAGGQGVYGQIPMPAQQISADDAGQIARWIVQGAEK